MPFRRGDVVLADFPYVENNVVKRRPAVVVSGDAYNSACPDILVAQVTSRLDAPPRPGDYKLREWKKAGLARPSLVRARLATLHDSVVVRRLGAISGRDMAGVNRGLTIALELGADH